MSDAIEPGELRERLASGENIYLLDVREPDEVAQWAFPGAVNIPLGSLGERTAELPIDRPIVVTCHAGVRSASAADALEKAGWDARSLAGGAVAWIETEPTR
ncbi:MAG TPA: rhodanese-like domain-containing protein [Acidimicrobiales bacterium]